MPDWGNYPLTLSIYDVMDILKVSYNTAYKLFHQDDFPAVKFGRTYRVSREAFRHWMENARHQTEY